MNPPLPNRGRHDPHVSIAASDTLSVFERRLHIATLATCCMFSIVALLLLSSRMYVAGALLAPLLLAPFIIVERLLARIRSADPARPQVVPLIYAHILFVAALVAGASGATPGPSEPHAYEPHGSIPGILVGVAVGGSWILVAVFAALGRRYRPILAVVGAVLFAVAVLGEFLGAEVTIEVGLVVLAALTTLQWALERRIARECAAAGGGSRRFVAAPGSITGVALSGWSGGVELCGGGRVSAREGVVAAGHAAALLFVAAFGATAAVLATPGIAAIGLLVVIERLASGRRGDAGRITRPPDARSQMTLLIYAHVIVAVLVLAGELAGFPAWRDSAVGRVVVVVSLSIVATGWLAVLTCRALGPRYRWLLLVVAAVSFANWFALRWYGVHWPNELGSAATKALTCGYALAAIRGPLLFSISALTLLQWVVQRRLARDAAGCCVDGADALRWSSNSVSTRPEGMR